MRIKFVLLTTLILALGLTGFAQSKTTSAARDDGQSRAHPSTQTQTIEQFVNDVAKAWSEGNLASLDARRPYVGAVRVVVEAQVGEPPNVERKTFKTLAQIDKWFKRNERSDGPGRNVGPLEKCSKGVCTFEVVGMNHNNLFLQKITYGMRKGRPYLKAIYIADGA
jgi:hypothetical protein